MRTLLRYGLTALALVSLATMPVWAQGDQVVASLHRLKGSVNVMQKTSGETTQGRDGLLLRAGDTVVTEAKSNATIRFRDGSEIRLFQNTSFQLEESQESGDSRSFKHNLFLKLGSVWGNFIKQRQVAQIKTPTATIGIKGTTLRVGEADGKSRVSLTEGSIDVSNDARTVELVPGKRITPFGRNDDLATKIEDIPYKLDVTADKRALTFAQGRAEEVFLTVQLIDVKTGRQVNRPGPLYLRSNYDKIAYPAAPALDQRGAARVTLTLSPPDPADAKLNGNVFLWAVLDSEEADDTGEGRLLFTIPVPPSQERIRVQSDTGAGKRVQ